MINLPAYSGTMLAALLFSNVFLLFVFFVMAGPVFITGRDVFGRPLEQVGFMRRAIFLLFILGLCAYFAVQAVTVTRFLPYFIDRGEVVTETVTATTAIESSAGAPIAFWITTERHRFGVSEEIFEAVATGDEVRAHYRPADDTLYRLDIVHRHNEAGPSPTP